MQSSHIPSVAHLGLLSQAIINHTAEGRQSAVSPQDRAKDRRAAEHKKAIDDRYDHIIHTTGASSQSFNA